MPAVGEALWTQEDRDWARALLDVEAESCPDCGQPWAESSSINNEDAYTAQLHRCHACSAGAKVVAAHQKRNGSTAGLHVMIVKR